MSNVLPGKFVIHREFSNWSIFEWRQKNLLNFSKVFTWNARYLQLLIYDLRNVAQKIHHQDLYETDKNDHKCYFLHFYHRVKSKKIIFALQVVTFQNNFWILQIQCLSPLFSQEVLIYKECAKYKIKHWLKKYKARGVKWCGTPLLIFKEYKGAT